MSSTSLNEKLKYAGEEVVRRSMSEWLKDIVDPPRSSRGGRHPKEEIFQRSREAVDGYIREGVLMGGVSNPTTFKYMFDGDYEWCGAFAAKMWEPFIHGDIRQLYWPSTYRLDCYGKYAVGFSTENARRVHSKYPRPALGKREMMILNSKTTPGDVDEWGPQAGDILIVGFNPGMRFGTHICIVEGWDSGGSMFHTIEGNATGWGPDTSVRRGVIKHRRPVGSSNPRREYHAMRLIRPGFNDLTDFEVPDEND